MRSPTRMGDEFPTGTSVFQRTFFCGPNSAGRRPQEHRPEAFGPRNCVQSAANRPIANNGDRTVRICLATHIKLVIPDQESEDALTKLKTISRRSFTTSIIAVPFAVRAQQSPLTARV